LDFVSLSEMRDIDFQIGVENRDYHYQSQTEIASDKRISQHLSATRARYRPTWWVTVARNVAQTTFDQMFGPADGVSHRRAVLPDRKQVASAK
jgi:hypothetical protein